MFSPGFLWGHDIWICSISSETEKEIIKKQQKGKIHSHWHDESAKLISMLQIYVPSYVRAKTTFIEGILSLVFYYLP